MVLKLLKASLLCSYHVSLYYIFRSYRLSLSPKFNVLFNDVFLNCSMISSCLHSVLIKLIRWRNYFKMFLVRYVRTVPTSALVHKFVISSNANLGRNLTQNKRTLNVGKWEPSPKSFRNEKIGNMSKEDMQRLEAVPRIGNPAETTFTFCADIQFYKPNYMCTYIYMV